MCCRANLTASLPTCLGLPSLPAPPALTRHPLCMGLQRSHTICLPRMAAHLLEGQDGISSRSVLVSCSPRSPRFLNSLTLASFPRMAARLSSAFIDMRHAEAVPA
ncbi:hypothetical protein K438DRAFT_1975596 [Mycena galopus ATCC 62051]|nr:hypothetical protein K438DRAFT_1975596 [Mycena galopus ATCC 62051]